MSHGPAEYITSKACKQRYTFKVADILEYAFQCILHESRPTFSHELHTQESHMLTTLQHLESV